MTLCGWLRAGGFETFRCTAAYGWVLSRMGGNGTNQSEVIAGEALL